LFFTLFHRAFRFIFGSAIAIPKDIAAITNAKKAQHKKQLQQKTGLLMLKFSKNNQSIFTLA
jgi:hypothetical protein